MSTQPNFPHYQSPDMPQPGAWNSSHASPYGGIFPDSVSADERPQACYVALIFSIVGLFTFPVILHLVAWVIANQELARDPVDPTPSKIAKIVSMVVCISTFVMVVLAALFFVVVFAAAGS